MSKASDWLAMVQAAAQKRDATLPKYLGADLVAFMSERDDVEIRVRQPKYPNDWKTVFVDSKDMLAFGKWIVENFGEP